MRRLVSGSWVYGTFSTWIGDHDKNRGWDMLVDAKQAFDETVAGGGLGGEALLASQHQLSICEGSDWFWWFGDYNSSQSVSDFEQLFRRQLKSLYKLLHLPEPSILDIPISAGGGEGVENAGTMRRNQ